MKPYYDAWKSSKHNFVKDAKGAHNFDYAAALLKKAQENLDRALRLLK